MIWCLTWHGPVYLQSLYLGPINKWATPAQKEVFQEPYLHGDRVGCFALSEPGMCYVVYIEVYFSKKKLNIWICVQNKLHVKLYILLVIYVTRVVANIANWCFFGIYMYVLAIKYFIYIVLPTVDDDILLLAVHVYIFINIC